MSKLVIVESPAKARTIGRYLGNDYTVMASIGHIRDLPQPSELPADMKKGPFGRFAVDVDNDFTPYYVVAADKKKTVSDIKKALKDSSELLLATDEDREGEAIAWHLYEVLKPKIPTKRMVFHEITPEAIQRALDNPRDLDTKLVDAQETRRILDRLVGYEVSPLLWRKVSAGLSAGRVQSVATRLVVDRERERLAFVKASYWDVSATFGDTEKFGAKLQFVDGARIATGKDFGDDGQLGAKAIKAGVRALTEETALAVAQAVDSKRGRVSALEEKPYRRRPAAPFTTSTLQQEAGRKLRMSSRQTMRTAQTLYESGYITYMRTDSTNLSEQAISAARAQIKEMYGAQNLPAKPRIYSKATKGAQEAHEAIRPAGDHFRTPAQVRGVLKGAEYSLYELIWKRTIASQMEDALGTTASVKLDVDLEGAAGANVATFGASGTVITFRGFLAAYEEGQDAHRYEDEAESRLPALRMDETVAVEELSAEGHETLPPPRYTEASLVKKMEELGIGRPSTYASTISTISDRGYVEHRGQALVPTWTAFSVVRLLEENLPDMVDYDFTASMETNLDHIATGEEDPVHYLSRFWRGTESKPGLEGRVESLGDIDARALNSTTIAEGIVVRNGRYGPYLEINDGEKRVSIPQGMAPDELTEEAAKELIEKSASDGRELGVDPESQHTVLVKTGRFGPYVTEIIPEGEVTYTATGRVSKKPPKPRTASLLKTMSPETVTLEDALQLLRLPRVIGQGEDGVDITAHNGRYGPYIVHGKDTRSLENEEQIFSLTLDEAKEVLSQPKRRRGQAQARPPLAEFGSDPVSEKPVVLKDGRFGPYVTDGITNASLKRDDMPEHITKERAFELLAERRAKGPAKKTRAKKTTKKGTTTKATAKKSATKTATKATTRKSSTAKSAAKKATD
ncbi:type I DNA topoisomerase [Actinotignum urinale]|uniref:type I DNA topoisomerase n=1 Tax=Actinotignum urinale TaxID=190146 RepID=UPI0003B55BF8|nr:type I DNA topoisomerase [Actinotignum urinale]MDY5160358.1 type I DNA topoisomerase [Actinotignum urinale]